MHKSSLVRPGLQMMFQQQPMQQHKQRQTSGGENGGGSGNTGSETGGGSGGETGGGQGSGETSEAKFTQADVDRIIADRVARAQKQYADYDDLKAAADELQKIKDGEKSELQKALDDAASWKSKYQESEDARSKAATELLREQVGTREGKVLPARLRSRIQGATKEEMEADADALFAEWNPGTGGGEQRRNAPYLNHQGALTVSGRDLGAAEAARRFGNKKQTTT